MKLHAICVTSLSYTYHSLVFNFFPVFFFRFLGLLEDEIYSQISPIWDPNFTGKTPAHVLAAVQAQAASDSTSVPSINSSAGNSYLLIKLDFIVVM